MIKLTVDEAYAFDYYTILQLKHTNGYITDDVLDLTKQDLIDCLGVDLVAKIMNSQEYTALLEANQLTFDAVDQAKNDSVPASYVDKCNYKRMLCKKDLQAKFFNNNISEVKVGYEKHQ